MKVVDGMGRGAAIRLAARVADELGPWMPVRLGLSDVPLAVIHCAHDDRPRAWRSTELWGEHEHPTCLLVPYEREGP